MSHNDAVQVGRTAVDYAGRWVDPVVEVERDAYRRGYNRGTLECAVWIGALIAVYVIGKPLAMLAGWL